MRVAARAAMRLLIVSQHFWPESFRINTLARALAGAGAEVTVLTGQPNYPEGRIFAGYRARSVRRERFGAVEVLRVPLVPRGRASGGRLAANYLSFIVSASILGPWLLRGRTFDVVFVYGTSPIFQAIPAALLRRLKGAKLVTWVQDLWPDSLSLTGHVRNSVILRAVQAGVRRVYRANDLLLGQSNAFVEEIALLSGGVPVEFFPNPGEEEMEAQPTVGVKLPDAFNVVFTGNLGTVQALDTVLEAAALLRDEPGVRLVLVGGGSRASWVAEEIQRRALGNVTLIDRVAPALVPGILSQAGALLVSLGRGNALARTIPAKLQAYLFAGRPILASMDGEGRALVERIGAGYGSPAEDAEALAMNVRRIAALPAEARQGMGERGRAYFDENYRADVLAKQLLGRLRLLADTTSPPPRAAT